MGEKVKRISVTIPENLFKEFEEATHAIGYKKRSKAISDAIQKFVADYRILNQIKTGSCAGTITYLYKHDIKGLTDTLTEIQHKYMDIISATLHVHLDEENCLETLSVKGNVNKAKSLIQKLKTLKTENVQYILIPQP